MLLDLLRDRTKHLHERIERTVDLPSRLGSTASYTALLTRFFGYYAPLEERLFAIGDIGATGIDLVARRKAPLLHADLISLGLCEADLLALPRCPELPAVVDASDALGCLYVTEGATLGGQMVRREVERRLGLTPSHGGAFFTSYGSRVGIMWREFCLALEMHMAVAPGSEGRVVAAAVGTFSGLNQWVSGAPVC